MPPRIILSIITYIFQKKSSSKTFKRFYLYRKKKQPEYKFISNDVHVLIN